MKTAHWNLVPKISGMSQDKTLMSQALTHSYFGVRYILQQGLTQLISLMAYQLYFILTLDRGLQDAQPLGIVALRLQLGLTVIFTQGSLAE